MALHTDVPTRTEIERLLTTRERWCVSIYVPTTPLTQDVERDRIVFRNQIRAALEQLRDAEAPAADVDAIGESLDDLLADDDFWSEQAHSLAVFATPAWVRTFRLPNRLAEAVHVTDRLHVKPLLRAVSFPQAAFVLALAQGSARLVEVTADAPAFEVPVADLPPSVAGAVGKASITDRTASGRVQGAEGQKVRMRQYARHVDSALRAVLAGLDLPLILACAPPLDAIFRSVNSYPHLAAGGIPGNPETLTDAELATASRTVLDQLYAAELAALRDVFEARAARGRAATELNDVARAATFGAVDTVLVDIDAHVPGAIDQESGAVQLDGATAGAYGVIDEIARRVVLSGGRVVAVRRDDVPGDGPAAAILRYPV